MVDRPHHFYLIEEGESVAGVGGIDGVDFGKCLDCEFAAVCDPLDLVNGGESAFAQFFDRFEHLMKSELIDVFAEGTHPHPHQPFINDHKLQIFSIFFDQLEAQGFGKDGTVGWVSLVISLVEHLELEIEVDWSVVAVLIVEAAFVAQSYVVIREGQINFLINIFVQPERRVDVDGVSPDLRDYFLRDGQKYGTYLLAASRVKHRQIRVNKYY